MLNILHGMVVKYLSFLFLSPKGLRDDNSDGAKVLKA